MVQVWSAFARFEINNGKLGNAEQVLRRGLEFNPLSQSLHYILGELLLRQGRADEAVQELDMALRVDYQEQYQHDVPQDAIKATAAQAYEAVGDLSRAFKLYLRACPVKARPLHAVGRAWAATGQERDT
jgi:tetratricopeptide (TPR) repeat protein